MARSKSKRNREKRRESRPPLPQELGAAGAGGGGRGAREQAEGSWLPAKKPDKIVPDVRTRAIQEYEKNLALTKELNAWLEQDIRQQSVEEMERFTITTDPTRKEILKFLAEKKAYSLKIAPLVITVDVHGDKVEVPVTPAKPDNPEDYTYHLIIIVDPPTGDQVHVLVEDFSGYIKAIRVVLRKEVASKKRWHLLRPGRLPTRFKKTSQTTYADDYVKLDSVCFHNGTFREIFKFFFSFDRKPKQKRTDEGQITLDSSFVALGELPRFEFVQKLLFEGLTRPKDDPCKFPRGFSGLIHDWAVLSKAIYQLYLAILEAKMVRLGMSAPLARKAMDKARELWMDRQKSHFLIRFYSEDEPLNLGLLCGGQLHLLCHDPDLCDQVTMRKVFRFKGHWLKDIQRAFDSGELAPGTH